MRLLSLALVALTTLGGCAGLKVATDEPPAPPIMRWDFRPEAPLWTKATLSALDSYGAALPAFTPADIDSYCPKYKTAGPEDRAAFWSGLLSALAKHESTWRPDAVGGGGLWYGLVQIDPRTARAYNCQAKTGAALKDGAANLSCAVRIASHQVLKRGTVSRGMLDWGPFHSASKRQEMQAWTRAQPYCKLD